MANEEAREAELDGYIHAARELNRLGNELRDQGYAGRDTDVTVTPLDFLRLIETATARGIRQAREAIEAAHPNTYDLNWAWQAIDALGEDDRG